MPHTPHQPNPLLILHGHRQARQRPATEGAAAAADAPGPQLVIGDCVLSVSDRTIRRGDQRRRLSGVEFAMLAELARNAGVVVSRSRLVSVSYGEALAASPRIVDAIIVRLRRAIEPDPACPRYIQTVRGHGYVFVPRMPVTPA